MIHLKKAPSFQSRFFISFKIQFSVITPKVVFNAWTTSKSPVSNNEKIRGPAKWRVTVRRELQFMASYLES